jgi:hypothetical protein
MLFSRRHHIIITVGKKHIPVETENEGRCLIKCNPVLVRKPNASKVVSFEPKW